MIPSHKKQLGEMNQELKSIKSSKNSSMKVFTVPLLFSTALFLQLKNSAALDTITPNKTIADGDTIVSAGDMFEFGFFSLRNSKNRYLGIWYKNISPRTVVWVANREIPVTKNPGVLRINSDGILQLIDAGSILVWSSSSREPIGNVTPLARLLDNGNLVVGANDENIIWQSFDYPGDTFLPGMKFGKDLVTGIDRRLRSWKSFDDPSPGLYMTWMDTNGFPQIFETKGSDLHSRFGPWDGMKLTGLPGLKPNPVYNSEFVFNNKEIVYKYDVVNSSTILRMLLDPEGRIQRLSWIDRTQNWIVYLFVTIDSCSHYGQCGPYGICKSSTFPACNCIDGFEPKHAEEWNVDDWSSGCRRKTPLDFGAEDGFLKVSGVKLPDTRRSWYNMSMMLGECEMACRKDFSCTAYANIDIRNGRGCLLWFDDLMDVMEYAESQDLYVRMAASELTVLQVGHNQKQEVLRVVLPILTTGLLLLGLFAVAYTCTKKKKRSKMKRRDSLVHVQQEDLDLPFISLSVLAKATNNFSIKNKLGEGGFGPVYKGVLEAGREVAVKRLSETSEQGLDEFHNEVICIAKLQHRNLVKLLGYCIQRDERMLIYEYMPNKSLDCFIFDETRRSIIGWPQRLSIIHGIARGLLYLHQDSRLQIIHRDLKASNILLDDGMNPKISDFGLARMFRGSDTTAKTKRVVGTYGYISPEYAVHGRFSTKSDVFSFGVLLLEIVSGKKNREFFHENHSDNLLGHAWRLYNEDKPLEFMCASLHDSFIVPEVLRSIHIGLLCVQNHAEDRPTMLSVVLMLISESVLPPPKQPAFFAESCYPKIDSVPSVDKDTITLLHGR